MITNWPTLWSRRVRRPSVSLGLVLHRRDRLRATTGDLMPNPTPDPNRTALALMKRGREIHNTGRQDRYGPPGTTDTPRYSTDGTRLPDRDA